MITICERCQIKYESTTINHCPICCHRYADTKDEYKSKEVSFMLSTVKGLKSMVVNSVKGTNRKPPGGTRLIDPYCGKICLSRKSFNIKPNK